MKKLLLVVSALFLLGMGQIASAAERPKTVLHVITVKFKDGVTEAQINKAVDAAAQIPGVLAVGLARSRCNCRKATSTSS